MLCFDRVKSNVEVFQAMTSLTVEEFMILCTAFETAWKTYFGVKKESEPSGPGRRPELRSLEDNLFFILFYLKCYPLQMVIGFLFGMSQSTANGWIHKLMSVLRIALDNLEALPERDPKALSKHLLSQEEQQRLAIDATERRVERPSDNDTQKFYYSGKKGCHSVKNNLIAGEIDRKVIYLGRTHEGKMHDKKIADNENVEFPEGTVLDKDTGYQGYEPAGVETHQPKKKPKGGELTEEEKEENRLLSRIRVVVEHVIGGVKRLHIVKDVFRNKKEDFEDLVMEIACGLHNFRTDCRHTTY
jgi:hypothetical protein